MQNKIARIENVFLEKAQYNLTVREQKIMLFLVSNIDPRQKNFRTQIIPVKELEAVLKHDMKKWGGLYVEMKKFARSISKKQITFPTDVVIDGQPLEGYINWFSSVVPKRNEDGLVCISFAFAPELKHFLLKLKQFARIDRSEVLEMKSFYSIRFYQLFKAIYQKQEKYRTVVYKTISVAELRAMLELEDKYTKFTEFRRNVLNPAHAEINKYTSLHLDMEFQRNSKRQVHAVKFMICHRDDVPKQLSLLGDEEKRSISEMTKEEILARSKKFEITHFKKKYPGAYRDAVKKVRETFGDKIDPNHPAYMNSIVGQCHTWFVENVGK